jgi:hypothetical protein
MGDFLVPRSVTWAVQGVDGPSGQRWPDVVARFEVRDGTPVCVEFRVTAKPGDRGITTNDLTTFDLDKIATGCYLSHASAPTPTGGFVSPVPGWHWVEAADDVHRAVTRPDPLNQLRAVARVYLTPEYQGYQRQAVAEWLGKSDETASRRIREARAHGLIPPKGAGPEAIDAARDALDGDAADHDAPAPTLTTGEAVARLRRVGPGGEGVDRG